MRTTLRLKEYVSKSEVTIFEIKDFRYKGCYLLKQIKMKTVSYKLKHIIYKRKKFNP